MGFYIKQYSARTKHWLIFFSVSKYCHDTKRNTEMVDSRQLFLIHLKFKARKGYSERRVSFRLSLFLFLLLSSCSSFIVFFLFVKYTSATSYLYPFCRFLRAHEWKNCFVTARAGSDSSLAE